MSELLLSILTPAVPSRFERLGILCRHIEYQTVERPVEHLVFLDNKKRTVGEKRDALLIAAKGKYVAFVDDDDEIERDYVQKILEASVSNPDVITFDQVATINEEAGFISFGLGNPNEAFIANGTARRNAWHVCAWRRKLAILSHFPAINYGEDIAFASKLWSLNGLTEVHIPKILHFYRHSSQTTEAPPPLTGAEK